MHNAGADKETISDAMASGISCSGSAVHLARVEPTTRFSTDGDGVQQLIQPGPLSHRQVSPESHGSLQSLAVKAVRGDDSVRAKLPQARECSQAIHLRHLQVEDDGICL